MGHEYSDTNQSSHVDYDRQVNARAMMEELRVLRAKLDVTEDDDEQRALQEDVARKILWLCWCGICAEVDQLLPEVVSYIREEGNLLGLSEIRNIIERTSTNVDDDQAHLRRIMLDAGAGTSKHQLLLASRATEQIRWSATTMSRGTPTLDTQATIRGTNHQMPSISVECSQHVLASSSK
ncbi:hypothetical protein BKA82DRAFT_1004831 [Pisolithus tinctorius]|uniref:DNAJ-containing protein X-domain domain-containing protein n=1 Tax=Pisolithus tinctorius Marx 270 TaxID=870435 RepID=A0A0C3NDH2_PISTI|nr:hypothetical protein BKA82DRAFT_1004831 [Pisolithus tinctorius]KIN99154.1 hypothetical protein M404DRAFT_1004831 [Pisolithus tinctorius Marx 270]